MGEMKSIIEITDEDELKGNLMPVAVHMILKVKRMIARFFKSDKGSIGLGGVM
jgi:hypothetical protein